jgi:hypothetical protein
MRNALLFVVLSLLATSTLFAQKANEMRKNCISLNTGMDATPATINADGAECLGFMEGWEQGVNGLHWVDNKGNDKVISLAGELTISQMSRMFVVYLDKHPEMDNKTTDFVLTKALVEAGMLALTNPPVQPVEN